MPPPQSTNSLVPTNQNVATFAQQGSLDWVALAQTQVCFSVGILSRLSRAGIEPLTVTCGQHLCKLLPLGIYGEKIVKRAMGELTAKPCAEALIWFGIGIKHVLRDLAQTSQGCSLLALCSALSEAHSYEVGALILHQLMKECRAPEEIAPSFAQWEVVMKVASPVLNTTSFGLHVNQILRLGIKTNEKEPMTNSHATDIAKVLLDIGQIVSGSAESVCVQGGASCSWIAAWTDYILGLRTLVIDLDGNIVHANFANANHSAQVTVQFVRDSHRSSASVFRVSKTHFLRSGSQFITDCFNEHKFIHSKTPHLHFSGGRLQWDTMLHNAFGMSFDCLVRPVGEDVTSESTTPPGSPPESCFIEMSSCLVLNERGLFARLMAVAAFVFVLKDLTVKYHQRPESYLLNACINIPELSQSQGELLSAVATVRRDMASHTLQMMYSDGIRKLSKLCRCVSCRWTREGQKLCLVEIVEAVIYLSLILDRLVLDSDLTPTLYGLLHLTWRPDPPSPGCGPQAEVDDGSLRFLHLRLSREVNVSTSSRFLAYAPLFSGELWDHLPRIRPSAWSDGKIYCYIETLANLTDCIEKAALVHVGSGGIQYRSHLYSRISGSYKDRHPARDQKARRVDDVEDTSCLQNDTTYPEISTRVLIQEQPQDLCVCHQITAGPNTAIISPTSWLEVLKKGLKYQVQEQYLEGETDRWHSVLYNSKFQVFEGEGGSDSIINFQRHTLRPLRGNLLGRCAAMTLLSDRYFALVRDDAELKCFARFWANYRDQCNTGTPRPVIYYVLIS